MLARLNTAVIGTARTAVENDRSKIPEMAMRACDDIISVFGAAS
jgi:hypothetical protein